MSGTGLGRLWWYKDYKDETAPAIGPPSISGDMGKSFICIYYYVFAVWKSSNFDARISAGFLWAYNHVENSLELSKRRNYLSTMCSFSGNGQLLPSSCWRAWNGPILPSSCWRACRGDCPPLLGGIWGDGQQVGHWVSQAPWAFGYIMCSPQVTIGDVPFSFPG